MGTEKAYKNQGFLASLEARPIRILCEYEEPRQRLRNNGVDNTIVFFGSARVIAREVAEVRLEHARREVEKAPADERPAREKALRVATQRLRLSRYYDEARLLSRRLTRWSMERPNGSPRYIMCSGGGPGIMEATNRGASDVEGSKSVGLGISLPFEEKVNQYVSPELAFEFHYFFMRKYWFVQKARGLVVFPGGFGTLDELMETLTLLQTSKLDRPVTLILYGSEYWTHVLGIEAMLEWGTISNEDLKLIHFSDNVDDAFAHMTGELVAVENGVRGVPTLPAPSLYNRSEP